MEAMTKRKLFESFEADKTVITTKKMENVNPSECSPDCEVLLDDFAASDVDKTGVWYHGEGSVADIAAALRRFAMEKGYHILVSLAETAEGKEVILLSKMNEAEFMEAQEKKM